MVLSTITWQIEQGQFGSQHDNVRATFQYQTRILLAVLARLGEGI